MCFRPRTFQFIALLAVALYALGWPSYSLSSTAFLLGHIGGLPAVDRNGGVVITGCSGGGIGRHAAETLATDGWRVFCSVRKQSDKEELDNLGIASLTTLLMDVTKSPEVDSFAEQVLQLLGDSPLVGVVNNAGISKHVPTEFTDIGQVEQVMDVNLYGVIRVTKAFLPALRAGKGRIVNIGSLRGLLSTPDGGAYGMSKFALESLTDVLRTEVAHMGVSVTMINPGYIKTKIGAKQIGEHSSHNALTAEQVRLYDTFLPCLESRRIKADETAGHPMEVTAAIDHALFSPYPRYYYIMGTAGGKLPAWVGIYTRWFLPRVVQDLILVKKFQCTSSELESGQ